VVAVLAALLSVAFAALAFFRVSLTGGVLRVAPRFDLQDWLQRLPSHLPWVVPFVALTATLAALRAIVWGRTLPTPAPGTEDSIPRWRARFHALAMGGLVNNVIPGHLGLLASAWVLSREARQPMPAALASQLLAKLLEFGALFTMTVLLAAIGQVQGVGGIPVRTMLWAGGVAMVVFVVALLGARRFAPRLAARLTAHHRLPRVVAALDAIGAGLAAVHSPSRLVAGWLLSFLPVLASALSYGLALRHMGGHSWLLGGGLLLGAVTFSQMVPGLPSSLGLYYFICATTARSLGVPDEPAAALAALSHVSNAVAHILVGVVSLIAHHEGVRDLLRVRAAVRRTVPPAI
jgi:hypothetical protein